MLAKEVAMKRLTQQAPVTIHTSIIISAAAMALMLSSLLTQHGSAIVAAEKNETAIRPFRIQVPNNTLVDLRRRLAAARWPDNETVTDQSQGVRSETMKE